MAKNTKVEIPRHYLPESLRDLAFGIFEQETQAERKQAVHHFLDALAEFKYIPEVANVHNVTVVKQNSYSGFAKARFTGNNNILSQVRIKWYGNNGAPSNIYISIVQETEEITYAKPKAG